MKTFLPIRLLILTVCALLTACAPQRPSGVAGYEPREGDIAFQSLPHNPLIDAIEGCTESPFSHCGILHRSGNEWVVIEAIGPVKETPLPAWIRQGREEKYSVFRLKDRYRAKIPAFVHIAKSYKGLPYDIHYDFDDKAIYCSELIFKSFRRASDEELGRIQLLGDLKWQPHADVIKKIEGGKVPLERKMITPRSMSEARQLELIYPR